MDEKLKNEILKYYIDNGPEAEEYSVELATSENLSLKNQYNVIKNAGIQAFQAYPRQQNEDEKDSENSKKIREEESKVYNSILKYLEDKIPNFYYHKKIGNEDVNRSEETLAFLKDAVMEYTKTEEYKERLNFLEDEIKQLETSSLEEIKKQYAQETKEQHQILSQNVDLVNRQAAQQFAVLNQEIKVAKESIALYEKLKRGQPEKVKQLEEEWSKLYDKLADEEDTRTYTKEKENIEWPLVFYTENLEYLEQKINEEQEKIKQAEAAKQKVSEERVRKAKELEEEFYEKYGEPQKSEDKSVISMGKYPPYIKLKAKIKVLKDRKEVLENPQKVYEIIQQMINQKEDPEKVKIQVNNLASILGEDTIKGTLPWLEDTHERLVSSIEGLTQEQDRLINKLAGENGNEYIHYFKQEEFVRDQEMIKKYETDIVSHQKELEDLQEILNHYHKQRSVREYKQELKKIKRQIFKRENEKSFIATTEEERKILTNIINKLYEEEANLREKIRQVSSLNAPKTDWKIKKQIEEKSLAILENKARIKVLKEKSEKDYLDMEAHTLDQQLLKHVNAFIKSRLSDKEYSQTQQLDELVNLIIIDYKDSLEKEKSTSKEEIQETEDETKISTAPEGQRKDDIQETEEIDKYENAKPSLLEKIKSIHFKEKMILALTTIATAATTFSGATSSLEAKDKETSTSIKETGTETKTEEKIETQEEVPEEKSSFEQAAEELLEELKTTQKNELKSSDKGIDYLDLFKNAIPGRFYITVDDKTLEIPMYEVENYFNQGYEVVTCVEYDDGTIGFMHIDFTEKQDNKSEGMSR